MNKFKEIYMKRLIFLSILTTIKVVAIWAQKETFDITSYTRPVGWKKETKAEFVAFSQTDSKNNFCKIFLFKSLPSSGGSRKDFDLFWEELAAKPYEIKEKPHISPTEKENGWEVTGGGARFNTDGTSGMALLTTISNKEKVVSILTITNSNSYLDALEKFTSSLELTGTKETKPNSEVKAETVKENYSANNSGISVYPTRFDDGWVSVPENDWVRVTKGNITVLLHYGQLYDDAMRINAPEVCWNRLAAGRYQVTQRYNFNYSALNFPFYYTEAAVTEKATGKKMYVGFRVIPVSGVAYCVEVQAPSKEAYTKQFPYVENLETMRNYNRFALSAADLAGNWSSFGSSFTSLYNVYTGGNAGLNYSSIRDEFNFGKNGTYSSKHAGASSFYGSSSYFKDQFNGRLTITHWDVTLTNRKDGRTESFHAQFEAVKGGRILYLTNKQYSGMKYQLVKTK